MANENEDLMISVDQPIFDDYLMNFSVKNTDPIAHCCQTCDLCHKFTNPQSYEQDGITEPFFCIDKNDYVYRNETCEQYIPICKE